MKKILTLILISGLSLEWVCAQTPSCSQVLRLARATYEQGRLHEVAQLFDGKSDCFSQAQINGGLTKSEKVEAYKLLTLTFIYLEEPEKADESMINLKKVDPYYEPNPQIDPAEFVALFNTFRKEPIYRIGIKLGGNFSRPNISDKVGAVSFDNASKYNSLFGIQFGAAADLPLGSRLTLHSDILFQQHRFGLTQTVERQDPIQPSVLQNELVIIESQSWLSVPITLEYNFLDVNSSFHRKFRPYVAAGAGFGYLLNSSITAERQRDDASSIPESGVDITREKINISGILAAGAKLKMGSGLIVIEARYAHGINSLTSDATAFENESLLWNYGYADSNFKISSMSITLSYVLDVFKPKKITPKR
jgi:hypothetical protein